LIKDIADVLYRNLKKNCVKSLFLFF